MQKKDVLHILTRQEAAKAIKKDASQVSRMPEVVPKHHQSKLILACVRKVKKQLKTLRKLTPKGAEQICRKEEK